MPSKPRPCCQTLMTWLRDNGFRFGGLTGTDARALAAAVHIIELYSLERSQNVLTAFGLIVRSGMQQSCWHFAYHAIAHIMEWSDRERLWILAGLPILADPGLCDFEPGGARRCS